MTDMRFPSQHPIRAQAPVGQSPSAISADQRALMDEMQSTESAEAPSFSITLDESADLFVAVKDGVEFGEFCSARKMIGCCSSRRLSCRSFEERVWPRRLHEGFSIRSMPRVST